VATIEAQMQKEYHPLNYSGWCDSDRS